MRMTPQHISNIKSNPDIKYAAQNYQKPQNGQQNYANMDGSLKRQGSW
jgi:hypothetical protein